MISFQKIPSVDLIGWFPCVVALGITLPFDEVLERSSSSVVSVVDDTLDFILRFSINQIRRWAREV